jgi:hypothetical protein
MARNICTPSTLIIEESAQFGGLWGPAGSRAMLSVPRVNGEAPVMLDPGDEMAAHAGGYGRLRASHADREHVIDTLKAAYVFGFVAKDEFDARVSQTLASRTYAELELVTADLPAWLGAAQPPAGPARARDKTPARANVRRGDRAIMATAIFAGLALIVSVFDPVNLGGLLVVGATGSAFLSLFLLRRQLRGSRCDKRPSGQLPPQRAIGTGPSAGRRAVAAASAEPLPHASKSRRSKADAARGCLPRPQLS